MSGIVETTDLLKIKGFLLTVDKEKDFDSAAHQFLINVLETFAFEKSLARWMKTLLKNQESCIINGEITTNFLKIKEIYAYICNKGFEGFCQTFKNARSEQTVKILGIHFSYDKKVKEENRFNNHIAKIDNVFKRMEKERLKN